MCLVVGKWNTGFYCPDSEDRGSGYCCGSDHHKYCCSASQQVGIQHVENITLLIGVLVGVATAILMIIVVVCVCSPWSYYKRRKHTDKQQGGW